MKDKVISLFWTFFILLIIILALLAWIYWSNADFTETFYSLYSNKVETPVRIIFLSDLHQKEFGEANAALITRVEELEPDIILIAGDMVNKKDTDIDVCVALCERLTEIAPVYYSLGNHENEVVYGTDLNREFLEGKGELLGDNPEDFTPLIVNSTLLTGLTDAGVFLLQNDSVTVQVNGNWIDIGGISTNISSFWPNSGQFIYQFAQNDTEHFKILLSHRPEPVMKYIPDYAIDLVVAGHNHGGIIRIPGKGGLLSVDDGLFPTYDAGIFKNEKMTMVVSRGLGSHGLVPRIFNRPELVVIDMN